MSGKLIAIQKRIKSTKNTRKITKAMQLEASSKMKKLQAKAISSREYTQGLLNILENVVADTQDDTETSLYTNERETGKTVFILYSSDKGLCGGLNTRIINTLFSSKEWINTNSEDRILITIGKKGQDYANYNKIKVDKAFKAMSEKITLIESLEIIEGILEYWTSGEAAKIYMASPHYKSSIFFYPQVKSYLPLTDDTIKMHITPIKNNDGVEELDLEKEPDIIYEPSFADFKDSIIRQIIQAIFLASFLELKASEYSSRMLAMQNATDSAGEIIDTLTLDFNKARQASITQEIAEIVAGASS